jgi:RNA-binding protein 39
VYKGKMLRVGEAGEGNRHGNEMFLPAGEEGDQSYLHNLASKQALMHKLNKDTGLPMNIPSLPGLGVQGDTQLTTSSNCLLLSNLFDPALVNLTTEPDFFNETRDDVKEECRSFGEVESVFIDPMSRGNVWVKFSGNNVTAAKAAMEKLNGRWFASRPIMAALVPESTFDKFTAGLK